MTWWQATWYLHYKYLGGWVILTLSVFPILVGPQYLRSKVFSQSIKILIASIALLSMVAATVNHYHFQLVFRVKWPQTSHLLLSRKEIGAVTEFCIRLFVYSQMLNCFVFFRKTEKYLALTFEFVCSKKFLYKHVGDYCYCKITKATSSKIR